MPGDTPTVNTRVNVKRYRPTFGGAAIRLPTTNFSAMAIAPPSPSSGSTPLSSFHNTNMTATPYASDKYMLNQLQSTLSRVTAKPPPIQINYGSHSPTRAMQHNYSAYSHSSTNLSQQATQSDSPAWATSLRRTGVDPFESQYQPSSPNTIRVGPGSSSSNSASNKVFSQHEASDLTPKSPMPRAVNLQYNTPIGLYSNANIQEEYYKKVGVGASSEF